MTEKQLGVTSVLNFLPSNASSIENPDPKFDEEECVQGRKLSDLPPMLRQYLLLKRRYEDRILLFQVGDFYEVFFSDAEIVADALDIRLTSRNKSDKNPIPMCGVPTHALDNYLPGLLKNGFSCVVVSQTGQSDPTRKGGVKREISKIVTPGVRFTGEGLESDNLNYLFAVAFDRDGSGSVAWIDVSVGHLHLRRFDSLLSILEFIEREKPGELVLAGQNSVKDHSKNKALTKVVRRGGGKIIHRPLKDLGAKQLETLLEQMLETGSQSGLQSGTAFLVSDRMCLFSIIDYLKELNLGAGIHLSVFSIEKGKGSVVLDRAALSNLEVFASSMEGDERFSLYASINKTCTPMGARLLKRWLVEPSRDLYEIVPRHDAVEEFTENGNALKKLSILLKSIGDLERTLAKIRSQRAVPRDFTILRDSLTYLPGIAGVLKSLFSCKITAMKDRFDVLKDIHEKLQNSLADEVPIRTGEGGIFRNAYNSEIDELRKLADHGKEWLQDFAEREKKSSNLNSLKVKYNNAFGYFIEVPKSQASKIPNHYERRQTLTNVERFVTEELKNFEKKALSARDKQISLEDELFMEFATEMTQHSSRIAQTAEILTELDVLTSFALLAGQKNYVRPIMVEESKIDIKQGRHPIVERVVGEFDFVANDTQLNTMVKRFAILTGPNMGGKSTYLRQIGLIQLLSQIGCFVPAESAELGVCDRIFTRIGSGDDISRGESTFMVEMKEAASILQKATPRSLVLIDEIGRGTATADGLAIARAVAECLHSKICCQTVFATHFHELTNLALQHKAAFCLAVGAVEINDEVFFTHKIEAGAADRSYGIEVARLAGLPDAVIQRADELLRDSTHNNVSIQKEAFRHEVKENIPETLERALQRDITNKLAKLDPDSMTPMQALSKLAELRNCLQTLPLKDL